MSEQRTIQELAQADDLTPDEQRRLMEAAGLEWMLGLPDAILVDASGNPVEQQPEA